MWLGAPPDAVSDFVVLYLRSHLLVHSMPWLTNGFRSENKQLPVYNVHLTAALLSFPFVVNLLFQILPISWVSESLCLLSYSITGDICDLHTASCTSDSEDFPFFPPLHNLNYLKNTTRFYISKLVCLLTECRTLSNYFPLQAHFFSDFNAQHNTFIGRLKLFD